MKYFFLVISVACLVSPLVAQPDALQWRKVFKDYPIHFEDCLLVENTQGNIALFAPTSKGTLYFLEINPLGEILRQFVFPFSKSKLKSLIAIPSGYLLAGATKDKGQLVPALWTCKKNKYQLELKQTIAAKGSFNDLLLTEAGSVMVTGVVHKRMGVYRYLPAKDVLSTFYLTSSGRSVGNDLMEVLGNDFVITGHQLVNKTPHLFVWKIDADGKLLKTLSYPIPFTSGQQVLRLDNEQLIIGGIQYTDTLISNVLLRVFPNLVTIAKTKHINAFDAAKKYGVKMLATQNADLLLVGKKTDFGSAQEEIWFKWLQQTLPFVDKSFIEFPNQEQQSVQKNYAGYATDLIQLKNRDFLIATISTNGPYKHPVLYAFKSDTNPLSIDLATVTKQGDFYFSQIRKQALHYQGNLYTFSGYLLSTIPLKKEQISIKNRTSGIKALKMPLVLEERSTLPNQYAYYVEQKLTLLPAQTNELVLTIKHPATLPFEDTFEIDYQLPIPNLHIITIGINNELAYAVQDAIDIEQLFRLQEGQLFKRVYSYSLKQPADTKAKPIIDFLTTFSRNQSFPKIKKEDIILLYISSHGYIISGEEGKEKFILPGMDYLPANRTTYIDYQSDVLDKIKELPGKKVIFIDACKSGQATLKGRGHSNSTLSFEKGRKKIVTSPDDLITLTSSQENQFSVECDSLKNGAFTYAIKEAFTALNPELQVDQNGDNLVTLRELYAYLHIRVPQLAQVCHLAGEQNPMLLSDQDLMISQDLPIYYLNKEFNNHNNPKK